jgi:hypothetical protein
MHQFTSLWLASRRSFSSISRKWEVRLLSFINAKEQEVRGIEISANHLRSIHEGVVTVLHELFTKEERHLWEIKLPMKKEFDFALQVD